YIHRNPYEVFVSMRNFYKKLLAEFALQSYDHVDIDETILSVYMRMMDALERDADETPASRYVELRYDELDRDALGSVERIYDSLALPGFDAARPKFEAYLASVQSFEKNKFSYSDEAAAKVEARLGKYLEKWGYERPGSNAAVSSAPPPPDKAPGSADGTGDSATVDEKKTA
ncbi:MAG: sulfotransferase, partial [Pseudomonadota bacterium]